MARKEARLPLWRQLFSNKAAGASERFKVGAVGHIHSLTLERGGGDVVMLLNGHWSGSFLWWFRGG